jgi:hypothetical protein
LKFTVNLNLRTFRKNTSAVLLLVLFAATQLSAQTQSLGDVAREQKEIRKQREKDGETSKASTNDDLASGSATSTSGITNSSTTNSGTTNSPSASSITQDQSAGNESAQVKSQPADTGNKNTGTSHASIDSVLDRPKDSRPDVIVVPAGTELKVDIDQHKTVIPVRVGFATPIPALSQVTVEETRAYVGIPDFSGTPYPTLAYVDYMEYATVTAITVAGNTYEVQTNSLPLQKGGTNSEVTFVLGGPLKILR